jgi:hypothetical protein
VFGRKIWGFWESEKGGNERQKKRKGGNEILVKRAVKIITRLVINYQRKLATVHKTAATTVAKMHSEAVAS